MTNSYRESFEFLSRQRRPSYFFEQVTEIFFSSKERARYTFLQAPFFRREQCYGSTLKKRKKERKNQRSRREDSSNFLLVKEKPRYIFLRLLFRRETVPVLRRVRFHSSKKKKKEKKKNPCKVARRTLRIPLGHRKLSTCQRSLDFNQSSARDLSPFLIT